MRKSLVDRLVTSYMRWLNEDNADYYVVFSGEPMSPGEARIFVLLYVLLLVAIVLSPWIRLYYGAAE